MTSEKDEVNLDSIDEMIDDESENPVDASADSVRILEAILFASDELLTASRLKTIVPGNPDARDIRRMVEKINQQLQRERHPFEIVEIGGGYQFKTVAYYHPWVRQIFKEKAAKRLSIQALECLAIIAYRQPLSKAEIEAIRGVLSDGAMKTLLEKRLVTITGRSEKAGRPLLYGTTPEFLTYFGLNKIADLPKIEEFEALARERMEMLPLDELQQVNAESAECEPEEASFEISMAPEKKEPSPAQQPVAAAEQHLDEDEEVLLEVAGAPEKKADDAGSAHEEADKEAVVPESNDDDALLEVTITAESAKARVLAEAPLPAPVEPEEEALFEIKGAPEKPAEPALEAPDDVVFEKAEEEPMATETPDHENETIRMPVVSPKKKKAKKALPPKKADSDTDVFEVKID